MASNGYNNYGSSGSTSPQDLLAKAQRDFQNTQNQSVNSLVGATQITQKDGKSYWFGVELSPDMANTMSLVSGLLPNYINDFLRGGVYKHTQSLTNYLDKGLKLGLAEGAGHRAGLRASLAVGGLVVAAQPLTQVAVSVRDRVKNQAEIKKALADIIENNKKGYENNEVIKTAMERANDTMWTGIRHAAAELPTVILNGYYALQGHKEFAQEKGQSEALNVAKGGSVQSVVDARAAEIRERNQAIENSGLDDEGKAILRKEMEEESKARRIGASTEQNNKPKSEGEIQKLFPLLGTGIASSVIKTAIAKNDKEGKSKHCAYELIMDLQKKSANGDIREGSNISKQVLDIFQQNEIDRERPPFGPVLLEKLEPLAKRIAEVIAKNELEPLALVNLVGDGKVANKRHFVSPEELEKVIDEQRRMFGTHEKTSLDEFLADFQKPKMILAAITENLKTLEGNERALFATLFSDEVLLAADIKKEDILPLRTQGHDFIYGFVIERTKELAQETKEDLAKQGLSKQQIESIFSLNELIEAGEEKKVHEVINGGDIVVAAVRNKTLLEQLKGGDAKPLWAMRVARFEKKTPADIAKEHEQDGDDDMKMANREKHHDKHGKKHDEKHRNMHRDGGEGYDGMAL